MKRIVFLILVFAFTLSATIDERVSDIYFANSILTTKDQANSALLNTIKPDVESNTYNGDTAKMERFHHFKLAYNSTALETFKDSPLIAELFDMLEANDQLSNSSINWSIYNGLIDLGKDYLLGRIAKALTPTILAARLVVAGVPKKIAQEIVAEASTDTLEAGLTKLGQMVFYDVEGIHDSDLEEQVKNYKESIESGHLVISLAFGQGNLFTIEAYNKLPDWMHNYFYHLSVASPATQTAGIKDNAVVTVEGDSVTVLSDAVGPWMSTPFNHIYYTAPVIAPDMPPGEQVEWQYDPPKGDDACQNGYWLKGVTLPVGCQRTQYIPFPDYPGYPSTYTFTLDPSNVRNLLLQLQAASSLVGFGIYHELSKDYSFDFYMGEQSIPLYTGPNLSTQSYTSTKTKNKIIELLGDAINTFKTIDSQWVKADDINCSDSCDHRIEVVHQFDASLDNNMSGKVILPFDENGKLYGLNGTYVKGNPDGTDIIEVKDGTVCYELNGTSQETYGVDTGSIHEGALEVTMRWDNRNNDYNLSIGTNEVGKPLGGEIDVRTCNMQHYYVESEKSMTAGTYPVDITPDTQNVFTLGYVNLMFKLPNHSDSGEADSITKSMNIADKVAHGTVARIVIKKKEDKQFVYFGKNSVSTENEGNTSITSSSGNSRCQPGIPDIDGCGCITCTYQAFITVGRGDLGPLSGAHVAMYRLATYPYGDLVYTGYTVESNELFNAGLFQFSSEDLAAIDDDTLYVIEVQGGKDIDADDDMVLDTVSTQNLGTIHAVVPGSAFKTGHPKVNILTEIAYQIVVDSLDGDVNVTEVVDTLNDVTARLLRSKVYPQLGGELSYTDLLDWLPQFDQSLTVVDYDESIKPIVRKVLKNEDIHTDAYNVVYGLTSAVPTVRSTVLDVDENASVGTQVGHIDLLDDNSSVQGYTLEGDNAWHFSIGTDGTVSTNAALDYETVSSYVLSVYPVLEDGTGKGSLLRIDVNDIPDAPTITVPDGEIRLKQAVVADTVIATLQIDPGSSPLVAVDVEGTDSEWFSIDLNGTLRVVEDMLAPTEKSTYTISVTAYNETDISRTVTVPIVIEIEKTESFSATIPENSAPGTLVGTVSLSDGTSVIVSYELNGTSAFTIDNAGNIRVDENVSLDFEAVKAYTFTITGTDADGVQESIDATIGVTNVPEFTPFLHDLFISIDRETSRGTVLGNILTSAGDSDVEYVTLTPLVPFKVTQYGNLVLDGDLFNFSQTAFVFTARAMNALGYGNEANITVGVISGIRISDLSTNTYDGMTAGSLIGQVDMVRNGNAVETVELQGTGSEDFVIDLNGTIHVASGVTLDAERQDHYALQVMVNETYDATVDIDVLGRVVTSAGVSSSINDLTLAPDGTAIYVATQSSGLQIIDRSDPIALSVIGTLDTLGQATGIAVSTDGTKAYVVDKSPGLKVVDITIPGAPLIVGSVALTESANAITLSADAKNAYIANAEAGLTVVDLTDPTAPFVTGSADTPGSANGIARSSDDMKAYVADNYSGLQIIDISDPAALSAIGALDTSGTANALLLSADDSVGYVADGYSGLQIIDIGDPAAPLLLASLNTPGNANDIALSSDGKIAYLADGYYGLQLIDVSDPTTPTIMETIGVGDNVRHVVLSPDERYAYAAASSTLQIINIEGFAVANKVPGLLGFDAVMEADAVPGTVAGELKIYYEGESGILEFTLEGEGAEDFAIDSEGIVTLAEPLDYATQKNYALTAVAENAVGSRSVDINIRVHAVPEIRPFSGTVDSMAETGTPVGVLDMWLDNNDTLEDISLTGSGAEYFSVDTTGRIRFTGGTELHHFLTPDYHFQAIASNRYGSGAASDVNVSVSAVMKRFSLNVYSVAFSADETQIYVGYGDGTLKIFNITDTTELELLGSLILEDTARKLAITPDNTKLLATTYSSGIQIIDVSDPTLPITVGSVATPYQANEITVNSDSSMAFVADDKNGLLILDINNSAAISVIGSVSTHFSAEGVALSKDERTAFVADYKYGMQIVDIADPTQPEIIGSVDTTYYTNGVTVSSDGTIAYVADGANLQIIDITDVTAPQSLSTLSGLDWASSVVLTQDAGKIYVPDFSEGIHIIDVSNPGAPFVIATIPPTYVGSWDAFPSKYDARMYILELSSELQVIDLTGLE